MSLTKYFYTGYQVIFLIIAKSQSFYANTVIYSFHEHLYVSINFLKVIAYELHFAVIDFYKKKSESKQPTRSV